MVKGKIASELGKVNYDGKDTQKVRKDYADLPLELYSQAQLRRHISTHNRMDIVKNFWRLDKDELIKLIEKGGDNLPKYLYNVKPRFFHTNTLKYPYHPIYYKLRKVNK